MMILKILALGVTAYLLFAMIHHRKNKSLTLDIFMEYLLISVLVLVLLMGVLI